MIAGWKFDVGFAVFAALFAGLGVRLWALQVRGHDEAVREQDAQAWALEAIPPLRGTIYDCRGDVLAISKYVPSCFADPKFIPDPAATARALAAVLGSDASQLEEKIRRGRRFVWIRRHCTLEQARAIRDLKLVGVGFKDEPKREYPRGNDLASVIGYTDIDGKGLEGLERELDSVLRGREGEEWVLRDARRDLIASFTKTVRAAEAGYDVWLTIDARLQSVAEGALAKVMEKHGPESAVAVVMDPETGNILALSGLPTYDSNRPGEAKPEYRRCRAATDFWEPGSTFKGIVMAGLLEKGLVKPGEMIDCAGGRWEYRGRKIEDVHGYGALSIEDILVKSSNIGMAKMVTRMKPADLEAWVRLFGFGKSTGSGIPGETGGTMPREKPWQPQTMVSASFGYAVGATPLQMASAYCAIANGGRLTGARLVLSAQRGDGQESERFDRGAGKRILSERTCRALTGWMIQVVERGTGKSAKADGWLFAGKTGTTKMLGPDGKYAAGKYTSSFVGYGPAEKPKLLVLVVVREPQGAYYGGTVAAPAVGEILKEGLVLLDVKPEPEAVKKAREAFKKP